MTAANPWCGHPLLELRWPAELARLLTDPILRGHRVPRGDGRSVLLLPGFLVPDQTLAVLAGFLRRIGYQPLVSGIWFNSGCGQAFDQRIIGEVVREHERTDTRVAVVGHSRGGHYARSLAARYPEHVSHLITLGSAVEDPLDVSMLTRHAAAAVRRSLIALDPKRGALGCLTNACCCEFARGYRLPLPAQVRYTSIYSRTDGVVHWPACVAENMACVEISSSHLGMAFNRHAYRAIARALAQ